MSKKFLIIQLRKLGDVLLTTPVIDVLKDNFPKAQIDFFTETPFYDIASYNPKLTNLFLLNKHSIKDQLYTLRKIRRQKYDYALDFFGNPRSAWWAFFSGAKNRLGYDYPGRKHLYNICVKRDMKPKYVVDFKMDLLKPLGIDSDYLKTSIYVQANIREKMLNFIKEKGWNGYDKIVGLVTPNNRDVSRVKNWRFDGFADLAQKVIKELNAHVLILWGPGEQEEMRKLKSMINNDKVIVSPGMNVKELAGILSYCSVVVTSCGGSKHIAVSQDVPTVTIFGPTQEKCWNPPTDKNIAVKAKNLECIECDQTSCSRMDCMKLVTTDMVFNAVKKILDNK
ncbi:glycosyltransferase family 9 protein [bacterium]